jgi:predicted TIM-barrel fold metal-dependent hydrolase
MEHRLISADSHVLIRDTEFVAHLPRQHEQTWRDTLNWPSAAPIEALVSPDAPLVAAGRAGEWDPAERLKDMDVDGVDAEVLYLDNLAGSRFYKLPGDACLAAFQAFNSAAIEFASADPDRLVPVYLLPINDVSAAVDELHRLADQGARAVQLPLYPTDARVPPYYDPVYEPLWSAIEETDIPISLHVCPPGGRGLSADPTPAKGLFQAMPPILMSQVLSEWIVTGKFVRHPRLRVVLVEAGLGWIPYMLDRLDRVAEKSRWKDRGMELDEAPSYYWHRNMHATFEEDELGLGLRGKIGVDNLLWASDYPHPDSTWPESQKVIAEQFAQCSAEETRKMIFENASTLYRL